MKRLVCVLVVLAAAACGLNPQPFPPDNPDAAGGIGDASKGNDATSFGDDAGEGLDAANDSMPVPESDGGADADADAADASDALIDAPLDAIDDLVVLDVATD